MKLIFKNIIGFSWKMIWKIGALGDYTATASAMVANFDINAWISCSDSYSICSIYVYSMKYQLIVISNI